jgi:DNA-binding GntR family transcriptional regulator
MINLKSLREQVYEFLRQELHSGKLVQGSSINLNEISLRLGISKTPLRDALLQLEVDGFVTIAPRSGIYVNRLCLDTVRHLYEMAGALETSVILSNFKQIGHNRIAKMKRLNVELRKAIEREDFDTLYKLNLDFHDVFMELSDNTALRRIVSIAKQRLYDFPRRGYIVKWELRNCEDHDQLIDAIQGADLDRITSIWMEGHWGFSTQEKFIRQFHFPDPEDGKQSAEIGIQNTELGIQNANEKIEDKIQNKE